ncbi:MAG: DUF11 domain-containing protein, partial [Clostridiales bacterium]|nr:DUF11 domain-containing protein [Clostridiales bacterium]
MQEYIYPTKEKALMGETLAASADLSVMMGVNLTEANSGDMIVYTVSIANHGPDAAIAPTVTDALPAVLENHEFSVDNGANWSAWQGSYTLPDIAPGLTYILMLRGTAAIEARGSYQNTAEVASATPDPNHADNTARSAATQYLPTADLSLAMTVDNDSYEILLTTGDWATYTVTVTNNGPAAAVNPLITVPPPDLLENTELSLDGQATWSEWTETIPLGDLAAGGSVTVYLRGQLKESDANSILNTAFASCDNYADKPYKPAFIYVYLRGISGASNVRMDVTEDNGNTKPGESIEYRIYVSNYSYARCFTTLYFTPPP